MSQKYEYITDSNNPSQQILVTEEEAKAIRIAMLRQQVKRNLIQIGVGVGIVAGIFGAITVASMFAGSNEQPKEKEEKEEKEEAKEQ